MGPKIAIGSDGVGFELKEKITQYLRSVGLEVTDFGTHSSDAVDYPDYAAQVAKEVASGEFERGILVCGTGLGMSIAANKVRGIRAAVCHDLFTAKLSREHNDANVLALGAWVVKPEEALKIVSTWLNTNYEGGRHVKRLEKIKQMEE